MSYNNGKITAPVSIRDVQQALGDSSTDLKTLCISSRINPWARYKPILIPYKDNSGQETSYEGRGPQPITDAVRKSWNYGIRTRYQFDGTAWNTISQFFEGLISDGGSDRRTADQVDALAEKGWVVDQVVPNSWFARLTDFVHTNNSGGIHSDNDGYDHHAAAYPTKVHEQTGGSGRTWQMGGTIFTPGQQITVEQGIPFRVEIPDDFEFLARFAYSVDAPSAANDYTDYASDAPGSVSVFEAIQSNHGSVQLIKEAVQGGEHDGSKYPNAERGVMIASRIPGTAPGEYYYQLLTAWARGTLSIGASAQTVRNEDDLYYTRFIARKINSGGNMSWSVEGTGTPKTLADWATDPQGMGISTFTELMAELERQARWLLFGQYNATTNPMGGTGTNPGIQDQDGNPAGTLYAEVTDTSTRQRLLRRALTAFQKAAYVYSSAGTIGYGRYLDMTFSGMAFTAPVLLYSNGQSGWDAEPVDYYQGELLVIEFYRRAVQIPDHPTISPFVVIPGYSYKISVNYVEPGMAGVDITGELIFARVSKSESAVKLRVAHSAITGTGSGTALQAYLNSKFSALSVNVGGTVYPLLNLGSSYYNLAPYDSELYDGSIYIDVSGTTAATAVVTGMKIGAQSSAQKTINVDEG